MATVDIEKLENKLPTLLAMYAFIASQSPGSEKPQQQCCGLHMPAIHGKGFYAFQTWCLKVVPAVVTQQ